MAHDETNDGTRSEDMTTEEKIIRVHSLEDFDRELARDGGETLEVPAWMATEYGIFPEDVSMEDDFRDDGQGSAREPAAEHRVPLCGRALEILDAVRTLGNGGSPIVFITERGKPLDEKRLYRLLEKYKIAAVPHGFRPSFRDWADEDRIIHEKSSRRRSSCTDSGSHSMCR